MQNDVEEERQRIRCRLLCTVVFWIPAKLQLLGRAYRSSGALKAELVALLCFCVLWWDMWAGGFGGQVSQIPLRTGGDRWQNSAFSNGLRATSVVYQRSYSVECLNPYMEMLLNHFFLEEKNPQLFKLCPMQCINSKPVWKERLLPGFFPPNSVFSIG